MFGSKKPTSQKLIESSERVIDVFTHTKRQLEEINHEAVAEQNVIDAKIADLTVQRLDLEAVTAQNERVIANINKILE